MPNKCTIKVNADGISISLCPKCASAWREYLLTSVEVHDTLCGDRHESDAEAGNGSSEGSSPNEVSISLSPSEQAQLNFGECPPSEDETL